MQIPGAVGSQLIVGHGQEARPAQCVAAGAKQAPATGTPTPARPSPPQSGRARR